MRQGCGQGDQGRECELKLTNRQPPHWSRDNKSGRRGEGKRKRIVQFPESPEIQNREPNMITLVAGEAIGVQGS